ncbi:SphA family protein [Roseococcus pinisoli]|uniref:Transporter n=1 Tax=Roseococcus pinisoli TaxID=2835040 RepID=A0ABS5QDR2_9PROT|nr:transporter [Roseococcus pinisoli]MBS7811846.1 transporter [Roseococcus pinisoli]
MRASNLTILTGMALFAAVLPGAAQATEAAAGHYVIGANAAPGAGIVPPEPGLYWASQTLYYQGTLGRSVQLPIAGRIESGLQAGFFSTAIAGLYVPKLDLGNFSLAFSVALPLQNLDARIFSGTRERSENNWSFGDMVITPVALGYRSGQNFFQARLDIFAPTGNYSTSSIANVGMNYWSFVPTIAYTRLGRNYDLSIGAGIDLNTRNPKTRYTSGAMFHLDATAIYDVAPGFGLGILASMMSQVADDRGGIAARLNGFRGQSFAVGPIARYNFQLGSAHLQTMFSWAPEFGVENRPTGNAFQFRVSGRF